MQDTKLSAVRRPGECPHPACSLYVSVSERGARVECRDCGGMVTVPRNFIREFKAEEGGCFEKAPDRVESVLLDQANRAREALVAKVGGGK